MDTFTDPLTFLVVGGAGVLIPLAVAFVSNVKASGGVKALLSGVAAVLTAGGAAIANVGNIADDWKNVVGAVLLAGLAAGGSLAAWTKGTVTAWIEKHFPGGIG